MDRLACVNVPALPLQLLFLRQPDWRKEPAAVVDKDKPQGVIRWVNEPAHRLRILPGMSYAQGLAVSSQLRGGTVTELEIETGASEILRILHGFSPEVEPAKKHPGIYWINAVGLSGLYASATAWAKQIRDLLTTHHFSSTVVVGFDRFASYAVACSNKGIKIFTDADQEQRAMKQVSLSRIPSLPPRAREILAKLGVINMGDFLKLPAQSVRRRFGEEAELLHAFASRLRTAPFQPETIFEPVTETIDLEPPDDNSTRLLFGIRGRLTNMLTALAERHCALAALHIRYRMESGDEREDVLRPADPTLDSSLITDLIRLRFESTPLAEPVSEIHLMAAEAPADHTQLRLFFDRPKRDLDAGNRALARIRAELGPDSVLRARLREGHLPESQFAWEPLQSLELPHPVRQTDRFLVRRLRAVPTPLPFIERPDGKTRSALRILSGPFVFSGGWWSGGVHRHYYFGRDTGGRILWVYYDSKRKRWFVHGDVE